MFRAVRFSTQISKTAAGLGESEFNSAIGKTETDSDYGCYIYIQGVTFMAIVFQKTDIFIKGNNGDTDFLFQQPGQSVLRQREKDKIFRAFVHFKYFMGHSCQGALYGFGIQNCMVFSHSFFSVALFYK